MFYCRLYKGLKKALPFHGYETLQDGLFIAIIPLLAGVGLGSILGLGDGAMWLLVVGLCGLAFVCILLCTSRDKDP